MRKEGAYLYLDLPVGVHPYSYDIWRYPEIFVRGVNGGAPPDPVFTSGQNWGFPPLHPENIRNTHYEYFIKSIRHQLSCANMLRIDHIMNFHGFFWIPHGMENRNGVYVRYNPEEFYAILTLESWKNRSIIIGEDLGMVPPEVRPEMEEHGIFRMFVGQYQLISENQLGVIPVKSIASLNTHDMFPFASFWQEEDIIHRQKIKLINSERAEKELDQRKQIKKIISEMLIRDKNSDIDYIYQAILSFLGRSPAYGVIVNLEDLWLETRPQNIPGTQNQANWTRKARYSFEEFSIDPAVLGTLKMLNQARSGNLSDKENMEIM
jgi:4-alpha-glucanotransferase